MCAFIKLIMRQRAKYIDRYSIVKMDDGTVGVFERKGLLVISNWGKTGHKVSADTEMEVIKNPCHLASDYLEQYLITTNL